MDLRKKTKGDFISNFKKSDNVFFWNPFLASEYILE